MLAQCDRLIGEVGRRHHVFSWLRNPEGGSERWLEVDAYYPSRRLVVLCRARSGPFSDVYRELVPAHELHLLELDPAEMRGDLRAAIRDRLSALELSATPPAATAAGRAAVAPAPTRVTLAPAPPAGPVRRSAPPAERVPAHPLPDTPATGLLIGLALVVALGVEFYLGIAKALGNAHWLLAFGLALDLGARAIGTIVAARSGETGWAWACVVIGSPAVAAASLPSNAAVRRDPAPLAGVLAVVAMAGVVLGLLVG